MKDTLRSARQLMPACFDALNRINDVNLLLADAGWGRRGGRPSRYTRILRRKTPTKQGV